VRCIWIVCVIACSSANAPAPAPTVEPTGHQYEGRPIADTCSYLGADWLDRPERELREKPEHVLDVLGVKRDWTCADVGAGTGYFTVRLARRAASVLATDVQPEMLRILDARLVHEKITNVTLVRGTDHEAKLPERCCDLVLLVDVYHELGDPAGVMAGVRRALKPTGKLALVEYRGEDASVPIKPEHKMTLPRIQKELGELGFAFVQSFEDLPDQRVVVFVRDDAPLAIPGGRRR
jgi:SAM-dependent methyltransferase